MPHSLLYKKYVSEFSYDGEQQNKVKKEQRINVDMLGSHLREAPLNGLQTFYSQMCDLLRETNDAQFGIVSGLQTVKDSDPVEYQWVRDATHSLPLEERMPHDSPVLEANNTLLRCLSRLRPIDYAIEKKYGDEEPGPTCRQQLQANFDQYSQAILAAAQSNKTDAEKLKEIKKLEQEFNTLLVKGLHEANLTQGCQNSADAEKLLFHYRNLSSLLENPARTMVTLTYDKDANILQRETQYPVTKKTPLQHEALEDLAKIQPYPFDDEKNAHNNKSTASQEADALFLDLMNDETTALSAQARKTHLVGAKNAFIVKNELIPLEEQPEPEKDLSGYEATKENTLWLARTGVPVYVGSGEKSERVDAHTKENLEQIRMAAEERMGVKAPKLHVTCLNTYSPLENQKTMVDSLYKATRDQGNGDDISYAPTNPDGTFRMMDVAPNLAFANGEEPGGTFPLQKKDRLDQVSKVVLAAANDESTVSIVQCASGQDRTGTAVEKATQVWMAKRYEQLGKRPDNIETMRAEGGNAAEITTHHIHGSPGMKTDSLANNFFGKVTAFTQAASEQFYRASANTNKKNTVGATNFLKIPSEEAKLQYEHNLKAFELSLAEFSKTISGDSKKQQFYESGLTVLKEIKQIAEDNPDAQELNDLNSVLPHCTNMINRHDQAESPEFKESTRRLVSLSQHVSGSSSPALKKLGWGLLAFACMALIVGGVLAAIPSGGTSLLLSVAGAAGLTLGAASAVAGVTAVNVGGEKGLAQSLSNFKSSLQEIKSEHNSSEAEQSQPSDELNFKF